MYIMPKIPVAICYHNNKVSIELINVSNIFLSNSAEHGQYGCLLGYTYDRMDPAWDQREPLPNEHIWHIDIYNVLEQMISVSCNMKSYVFISI